MRKNNRSKGHNFERSIASLFRELGFDYCKTSRAASKVLDDCGIDFVGIPFKVQAKAGYATHRPKFEEEAISCSERLMKNFPPDHPIHDVPFILIHKMDSKYKRKETDTYVSMSMKTFETLIRMAYKELSSLPHVF